VAIVCLSLCSCNSLRFDISEAPSAGAVTERKSFFLWGLAPTRVVDVSTHCPQGVKTVKEETNVVDGLLTLITIGIYSPRSSTYVCN
jgi:hypothetical protein